MAIDYAGVGCGVYSGGAEAAQVCVHLGFLLQACSCMCMSSLHVLESKLKDEPTKEAQARALVSWLRAQPLPGVTTDGIRFISTHHADDSTFHLTDLSPAVPPPSRR